MPRPEETYGSATIVITGASSGIGAALAERLASHGGRLALVARRRDKLEAVAERVRAKGATALVVEGSVDDAEQAAANYREVVGALGPVDVAFLNAGMGDFMPLTRFEAKRVRRLFEVNVFGVANWMEALLPDMITRSRGIVAVTSSVIASRGVPGMGAYAATKAAVSSLADSMRGEAKRHGIQITVIEPGFIRSELTDKNKFPMPLIMDADRAADIIARQVASGASLVRFPLAISAAMGLLRQLPNVVYDRVGASMTRKR